jgi:tetratricopeptide (TPR) repeat protein
MAITKQYRAFISYSHKDKAVARALHSRLEGYRIPRHLVGRATDMGPAPARLTPIFRDIDELPASLDLTEEIKTALAASEALIILCSPGAKASIWVAREIALFQELHGNTRPILCAVVDGDPQSVLPDALNRDFDPIAADFRKGQDGSKLALMKLVSGLTGLNLADLVQRDAQRRMRRVMAVTGIAAVIMLALVSSLILALRARAEAERNRNEAEGLVEYMLTDLRERLKGVGRLDVMAAVNTRAMDYYTKQGALNDLPPESLEKRARILHAMGEDDENGGRYGPALEKFMAAHRTTAAILAQRPRDANAVFAHAQSEYWVGRAAHLRKNSFTAMHHWQAYLTQAKQLAIIEPNTTRSLMEMGFAHGNICELHSGYQDATSKQKAKDHCRRSIEFEQAALRKEPNNIEVSEALANRYGWLARILFADKEYDAASEARENEGAILQPLVSRDPKNVDLQLRLMWQEVGVARIHGAQNNSIVAAEILNRVVSKCEALRELSGNRTDIHEFLTSTLLLLATVLKVDGNQGWKSVIAKLEMELPGFSKRPDGISRVKAYQSEIEKIKKGPIK